MPLHFLTIRKTLSKGTKSSEPLVRVRQTGSDWLVRDAWREAVFGPAAPDWFALQEGPGVECIKRGHSRSIWCVQLGDRVVYAKRLHRRGLRTVQDFFAGDPVQREWRALFEAQRRGIPVGEGLAVGAHKKPSPQSALLTRGALGMRTLSRALRNRPKPTRTNRRRRGAMVRALAELYAVGHQRGFAHRDSHLSNVLIRVRSASRRHQESPDGGRAAHALFVDVHGSYFSNGHLGPERSAKSLAQLAFSCRHYVSRPDRLRFLRAYLDLRPELVEPAEKKRFARGFWRVIELAAGVHAERLARHRDRRLSRSGKYFRRFSLGNGWTATVVLRLCVRGNPRTAAQKSWLPAQWRQVLSALMRNLESDHDSTDEGGLFLLQPAVPRNPAERVRWTFGGSPHAQTFRECHRLRHRDRTDDLILGVLEHRSYGLIDRTLLLRPAPQTTGQTEGSAARERTLAHG